MNYNTHPMTILTTVIITTGVILGGIYLWGNMNNGKYKNATGDKIMIGKVDCPRNWEKYDSDDFSFCYNKAWGAPQMVDETHQGGKGKLFKLTFANEKYLDQGPTTPQLWWETKNFSPEVADYGTTCFDCIDFNQAESSIVEVIGYEGRNANVSKLDIGGRKALRVRTDYYEAMFDQGQIERLEYFVPNAFGNYHLQALVNDANSDGLDTLMNSFSFK